MFSTGGEWEEDRTPGDAASAGVGAGGKAEVRLVPACLHAEPWVVRVVCYGATPVG